MCLVLLVSLYHGVYLRGGFCISEARFPVLVEDILSYLFWAGSGFGKASGIRSRRVCVPWEARSFVELTRPDVYAKIWESE